MEFVRLWTPHRRPQVAGRRNVGNRVRIPASYPRDNDQRSSNQSNEAAKKWHRRSVVVIDLRFIGEIDSIGGWVGAEKQDGKRAVEPQVFPLRR